VTKEQVKADLILTGTADDTLIESYITTARQFIENYAKVSILTQTWQVSFTPDELIAPVEGETPDRITLPRPPIQSVNTITFMDDTGTSTTLAVTTDYRFEDEDVIFVSPEVGGRYTIDYTTGYTDTSIIPDPFLIGIRIAATSHYENRESFVIPPGIRQLVGPLRRGRLV
jgi:uncharacterized phiE125 gp8 family phage protein